MQLKSRITALWLYDLNRQSNAGLNLCLDLFNGQGPYLITCIAVFLSRDVSGGSDTRKGSQEMSHMQSMITISLLFYLTDKMCPCQTYDVRVKLSFCDILSQFVFEYLKYEQKCVCVFQANNYNMITDITIQQMFL